ncbi:MAG: ABC transporter substrate-binding protein [Nitriliruptoraceae bacterium]|nr:ABC transporter substrate-binding protein [Nitriliruptoraceae bacterium]
MRPPRPTALLLVTALLATACASAGSTDDPGDPAATEPDASAPADDGADVGSEDPTTDGAEAAATTPDPSDWDAVLAAAQGSTLNLHMWGGSTEINRFVDDTYGPALAELGITLNRVPLADTVDAVNAVLGELEAGRDAGGAVDLIWINGANFATMRQADALVTGWARQLPNARHVDWDDPAVAFDAGLAVGADESPWGSAQFQFVYDAARMDADELPRDFAELAAWIEANPGRFTYPAPPAFHGTRFLKMWLYELTGGPEPWLEDVDEATHAAGAEALWDVLDELRPSLWRGGETYPNDIADLDQLFANGEVDLTFTQLPAGIDANIEAGTLPPTARPFVFDTGTIADHHYLAIPVNAGDPAAAMVFADLALDPALQAAKLDPANGWGDGLAIDVERLDDADRATIDAIVDGLGERAVDQGELAAARLPDSRGAHSRLLERDWDRFIRQRQPRP